jgi:hypothetical protein
MLSFTSLKPRVSPPRRFDQIAQDNIGSRVESSLAIAAADRDGHRHVHRRGASRRAANEQGLDMIRVWKCAPMPHRGQETVIRETVIRVLRSPCVLIAAADSNLLQV